MIELPRAALTAARIAEVAEFFSFGTNDLTQTTFGISRDDSGKFLPFYLENRSIRTIPSRFWTRKASDSWCGWARRTGARPVPTLKVGICGDMEVNLLR